MDSLRRCVRFASSLFPLVLMPGLVVADGLSFVMVSKSVDNENFIAAARACSRMAEANGDECLHVGPQGPAHFRAQDRAIQKVLKQDVDGIALSVTNGGYLAQNSLKAVAKQQIPLVTFDSDMPDGLHDVRAAYVGPDNIQIGRQLGEIVKRYQDEGTLCLMSASPFDTNLNERLTGVRKALTGISLPGIPGLLKGENGWTETGRCPWYNADDQDRAVTQVFTAYTYEHSDAIVSVGSWPLRNHERIRKALIPFREQLRSGEKVFTAAVGEMRPQDYALMDEGLVQGVVSIDFEAMGRASYRVLKKIHEKEPVREYWRTEVQTVLSKGDAGLKETISPASD